MPQLACPKCKGRISIDAAQAGQAVRCPSCQASFRIAAKSKPSVNPVEESADAKALSPSESDDVYRLGGDEWSGALNTPTNLDPSVVAEPKEVDDSLAVAPRPETESRSDDRAAKKAKKPSSKSKSSSKKKSTLEMNQLAILGGGGVLLVAAAIGLVFYFTRDGGRENVAADRNVGAENGKPVQAVVAAQPGAAWPVAVGPARPAQGRQVFNIASADAKNWSVRPDPVPPPPKDKKPVILVRPYMGITNGIMVLAHPGNPNLVSVIGYPQFDAKGYVWATFDVTTGDSVRTVELTGLAPNDLTSCIPYFSLSQDGDKLLFGNSYLRLDVWDKEGKKRSLGVPNGAQQVPWARFLTPDRLVLVANQKRYECILSSGEFVEKGPAPKLPIYSSATRKWAWHQHNNGFQFLKLPEWTPAGELPLPPEIELTPKTPVDGSFSRDGASFAAVVTLGEWNHIFTWDVAAGKLKDVLSMGPTNYDRVGGNVAWLGPRTLLLGSHSVIDLDWRLRTWKTETGIVSNKSPPEDSGGWGVVVGDRENMKALWPQVSKEPIPPYDPLNKPTPIFITIQEMLTPKAVARLAELRSKPALVRYQPVRAEVQSDEDDFREEAVKQFADVVAAAGYVVDPNAKIALRLRFRPVNVALVDIAHVISATSAMRSTTAQAYARASAVLDFLGPDGTVLWTGGEIKAEFPIGKKTGTKELRAQFPEVHEATSLGPPTLDLRQRFPDESRQARDRLMKDLAKQFPECFPNLRVPEALVIDSKGKPVPLPLTDNALNAVQ